MGETSRQLCGRDTFQNNRPKKSSTIGYVAGYAPREILDGSEEHLALVSWRFTVEIHY